MDPINAIAGRHGLIVMEDAAHNAHLYYLLLPTAAARDEALAAFARLGV